MQNTFHYISPNIFDIPQSTLHEMKMKKGLEYILGLAEENTVVISRIAPVIKLYAWDSNAIYV